MRFYYADVVGNVTVQAMTDDLGNTLSPPSPGIPVGVFVNLGSATSIDVTILDGRGAVIFTKTGITSDTYYAFGNAAVVGTSCYGAPKVTTANISNALHTARVWLDLKTNRIG